MGVYFSISSLITLIIFAIRYFFKEKVENKETKIYGKLLIVTMVGLFLEIFTCVLFKIGFDINSVFYKLFSKLTFVYYISWGILFFNYIVNICCYSDKKQKIINLVMLAICVIDLLLPVEFINVENSILPQGTALILVYIVSLAVSVLDVILCIKYHKKIAVNKFMPVYALLFLGALNFALGILYPQAFLLGYVYSIIIIIMFFTIENPDLKILNELVKNRELTEKSLEDRSTTLLTLSQRIRLPLKSVKDSLSLYEKEDDKEVKKQILNDTIQNVNELNFIVNDILNISNMDLSKIKLVDNEYNSEVFFKDIEKKTRNILKDSDIDFSFKVKKDLPPRLYGDCVKIKQILMTFINDIVNKTKEGFIDIEIDCIKRYDVLRLLIEIKSSDDSLTLEEINDLLKYDLDVTEEDFKKLDSLDVELNLAIKITRLLGGSINIKSEKGKGSIYSIVIDQKIKVENIENKDINKIENNILNDSILIVDDKIDELKNITDLFTKNKVSVVKCLSSNELLSRINNKEKYKFILIEDEMEEEKAYMVLKKLQSKQIKIPIIVMLNKDKEIIYKNYLEEGFTDILKKDKLNSEIKRIYNKYFESDK